MRLPTRPLPPGVLPASPTSPNTTFAQQMAAAGVPEGVREVALGQRHAVPTSSGVLALDLAGDLLNSYIDAFVQFPVNPDGSFNSPAYFLQVVGGALSLLNIAADALDYGIAFLLSPFAQACELPAACMMDLHVGIPHAHSHPPSLVPPAPPIPLPSLGSLMLSGAVTVSICGTPAARAGDVGLAPTCVSYAPVFMIATGSSSVFIGGGRAARLGDLTIHCNPVLANILKFSKAAAVVGAVAGAVGVAGAAAAGKPVAATAAAIQAAADVAASAAASTIGMDPAIPPVTPMVMGAITTGRSTVLIGGLPVPPADVILGMMKGELNTDSAKRSNRRQDDAEAQPQTARRNRGGACECP